ncbi:MAG: hypothetical protein AB8G14_06410 [Ilumatobacter sp.]
MADDALIAGAAAPARSRLIREQATLDALWVVVAACAVIASALFPLIDLPGSTLRTGDDPLRAFVIGLPVLAVGLAVAGAVRHSKLLVAVATGVLAPGAALAGSLALLLFLDRGSAFADGGVAVSLGAALVVVTALIRWFVYHPVELLSNERRPPIRLVRILGGLGTAFSLAMLTLGLDDADGSAAWILQTATMLLTPAVVIGASVVRSVVASGVAAGAAAGQVAAVGVAKIEQGTLAFDSDLLLRTGVPGLVLLVGVVGVSVTCIVRADADEPGDDVIVDDDASWRWFADD